MAETAGTAWAVVDNAAVRVGTAEGSCGVIGLSRGALLGVCTAFASYEAVASGLVPGSLALVLFGFLVVATPTAGSLPRRTAVNLALIIGWAPLLWWFRWPFVVSHGALVLACWSGLLAAVTVRRPWGSRWRGMMPRFRIADWLLLFVGALALATMAPWWSARSPAGALGMLLPGWDNLAHFDMFASARSHRAVMTALEAAPDGSAWVNSHYPQGFHALVATLSEMTSPSASTAPELVMSYTQTVSVVVALAMVALVAALLTLPGVRTCPAVATTATVFVCAAFLWEPGQRILADGFANFWLGAAATAAALLLAVTARPGMLADSAAVAGLLVAAVLCWAPLVVIAVPATTAMFLRTCSRGTSMLPRRDHLPSVAVWAFAALVTARTLEQLLDTVSVGSVIESTGGIHGTSPIPTFVMAVTAPYVCASFRGWLRRCNVDDLHPSVSRRIGVLALAPMTGPVVLALLLGAQIRAEGTSSYYFLKYLIGYELVMAPVTAGVVAMLVSLVWRRTADTRRGLVYAVVAVTLASQAFGRFPQGVAPLASDDGIVPVAAPYARAHIAEALLAAAEPRPGRRAIAEDYVAIGPGRNPRLMWADLWFHALTGTSTQKAFARAVSLASPSEPPPVVPAVVPTIRALLSSGDQLRVVVDPRCLEPVRSHLNVARLAERVVPWASAGRQDTGDAFGHAPRDLAC